ncbi:MAG: YfiR family protein [Bacteroidota bacterium]
MRNNLLKYILFCSIFCLGSCISKKKYLELEISTARESREYEERTAKLVNINDSLMWVMYQKDTIIDSLSNKINLLQQKKEKVKPVYVYNKKTSVLTKDQEYNKKALFIYNFAKNIEWPLIYNGTEFVIGVAGDALVLNQLKTLMKGKKAGGKKITIKEYIPGSKYNVVYIAASMSNSFEAIHKFAKKSKTKTLLIADEPNLNKVKAHISFIIDQDRVRYVANKVEIEKVGLKVSEELMRFSEKTL